MAHRIDIDRNPKKPREISLVPMINVIFLMLIFFVVAGKIQNIDILPVDMPLSEQSSEMSLGKEIITLGRHDEILAGDKIMFSYGDLATWIEERLAENPESRFTIKADANMEAIKLIEVMQFIEDAGADDVVLAAQKP